MKDMDIERLLAKESATPRRKLQRDFTKNIISYLDGHPRQTKMSHLKELLKMKYYTKPIVAVFAILSLAVVGSTAYAAAGGWPGIEAIFSGQKKLADARIVKVATKNCKITSAFSITTKDSQNEYYFKIKDHSKLTNDQVVQMVKGYCEIGQGSQASLDLQAELQKNPLNKDTIVGGYIDSKVTAISASSISIESDVPIGAEMETIKQTFSRIDPNVIVYQGANRLTLGDIRIGDHVSISYRASGVALTHSETINPAELSADQQVVVAISKNSGDLTAAVNYQKYNGHEFEQVIPCADGLNGYCTAEQYYKK